MHLRSKGWEGCTFFEGSDELGTASLGKAHESLVHPDLCFAKFFSLNEGRICDGRVLSVKECQKYFLDDGLFDGAVLSCQISFVHHSKSASSQFLSQLEIVLMQEIGDGW